MKWKLAVNGDYQFREGFLFFPKGRRGSEGFRWLEYAKWAEEYKNSLGWVFSNWIDRE